MTSYEYDGLDRPAYEIRESLKGNIRTDYIYDVNETGPVQTRTVSGDGLNLSSVTQYDKTGRTEYTEDAAGPVTSYAYSADGRTVTVTRPDLSAEITERYRDGRTKSVSGSGVIPVFYEYGVNPDGSQWSKVYTGSTDSSSPLREMSVTDMLGRTVRTEKPGPDGSIEVSENFYDAKGRLIRSVTPGQAAVLYEYDELGSQTRSGLDVSGSGALELSSADRITETETLYKQYGPQWWQESVQKVYAAENSDTAASAGISRTRITGLGTSGTYGILTGESISEDIHGNTAVQKSFINRTGKTGTQTVTYPDSDTAAVSVTQKGLLISSKGKSGHTVTLDYDTLGRRISVTDPRTGTSYTSYNARGQTESVTDAAGNRTEFIYDAVTGQKRAEKNALGKYTRYQYNARGQITRTWGEAVYPVEYVYDAYGRLAEMHTFRDGTGWESGEWPGTGTPDITKWHYRDATGLLLSKEYADGKQVGYAYAPAGKLSTRTWARTEAGQPLTTAYVYDPATGELTDIDYSDDTADISFAYDRLGRQKTVTDAVGTRTFAYNGKLQPESESITGLYTETLTRTYEDGTGVTGRNSGFFIGNPETPEYSVTYGYGAKGRFASVNWNAGAENGIVNYSYVPDSDLLSGYTTDTGLKTAYGYEEKRNLKTSVTNSFGPEGSETLISGYGYLYDSIGRRTSVKNTGTAFAQAAFSRYGYNDRSELTASERYSGTEITGLSSPVTEENRTYDYDPIGNRKESAAGTQQTLIYETNVLNQYKSISGGDAAAPEYDDDGNILKYKDKICQWNAENRLVSVQPQNPAAGDKKITFLYDYMGRRVRKQVFVHNGTDWNTAPESEKLFVYEGWNMVKETTVTGGGTSAKYYVWGPDLSQSLQGAGGIGGLLCSSENGTVLYYFYDGNGNAGQLINAADGSIAAHYEYDAFGNTVTSYGAYADENPFRFSTKYFDAETGLYYYGFRYYSPEIGRWWSRDPVGERGGINLYSFVTNSPLRKIDKLGKDDYLLEKKKRGEQIPLAVGLNFSAFGIATSLNIDKSTEGANNLFGVVKVVASVGMGSAYTFFPDSCEIAVFTVNTRFVSDLVNARIDGMDTNVDESIIGTAEIGWMAGIGGAAEIAWYIWDNTQGSANANSFTGIFRTVHISIGNNFGIAPYWGLQKDSGYLGIPTKEKGGVWVGGTAGYGPGIGKAAIVDWDYQLVNIIDLDSETSPYGKNGIGECTCHKLIKAIPYMAFDEIEAKYKNWIERRTIKGMDTEEIERLEKELGDIPGLTPGQIPIGF